MLSSVEKKGKEKKRKKNGDSGLVIQIDTATCKSVERDNMKREFRDFVSRRFNF